VGINLAIQDAVAAANRLSSGLLGGTLRTEDLESVQRRRMFPTRMMQRLQVAIQDRILGRVLGGEGPLTVPWPLRLFDRFPVLQAIPARVIGLGFRPEHVGRDIAHADGGSTRAADPPVA
jgi:2-polyprenyl-6-methoxyphenol hydroxylase-like FAD-dependent oxidoreductase